MLVSQHTVAHRLHCSGKKTRRAQDWQRYREHASPTGAADAELYAYLGISIYIHQPRFKALHLLLSGAFVFMRDYAHFTTEAAQFVPIAFTQMNESR